ncbi:hypothetical protein DPMN_129362 [Dreissena polymorpha]|uniref:Uncharacterized protein n=1 Tax=Dreissena polymorpha TaxID=45954 RepID=A0A9D4H2L0_DREPO|nr:hypothetical protein DPMN_129362 [Dreissena polymorpha]
MVLTSRIVTDQHDSFELPKTAVLASRSAKDIRKSYTDPHRATLRLYGSHAGSSRI